MLVINAILDLDLAILYKLKLGESIKTIPTIGFNVETITYRNVKLNIWVSMPALGSSLLRVLCPLYGWLVVVYVVYQTVASHLIVC